MRTANKRGYRDLVMSTEGISLNIVENATSDKLSKGDLKKAWGRLERPWNPKSREDKVEVYTKFLNYRLENVRQRPMDWLAFMEKKRTKLSYTGAYSGRQDIYYSSTEFPATKGVQRGDSGNKREIEKQES